MIKKNKKKEEAPVILQFPGFVVITHTEKIILLPKTKTNLELRLLTADEIDESILKNVLHKSIMFNNLPLDF